jgi:hypothetical protein
MASFVNFTFSTKFLWCKSNSNCHRCHSDSESSSSIHFQISQSYVAKCKYNGCRSSRCRVDCECTIRITGNRSAVKILRSYTSAGFSIDSTTPTSMPNFKKAAFISRTPALKTTGVRRRSTRTLCPCRAILQRSLGLGNRILKP